MKRSTLCIALLLVSSFGHAAGFVYQGTLNDGGKPAEGVYDLRLTMLDASGLKAIVAPVVMYNVKVSKGLFSAEVDFGIDLTQHSGLKLNAEVQQGGSGFVRLGDPTPFDAKSTLGGACWDTTGNTGVSTATLGTNAPADDLFLRMRAQGDDILYLRGTSGGIEQNNSVASGNGAAAWNNSTALAPMSFTAGNGQTALAATNSFVYADGSAGTFGSSVPDQFLVRADGGTFINTTTTLGSNTDLTIGARPVSGDADSDLVWRTRANKSGRLYLAESNGSFTLGAFNLTGPTFLSTSTNATLSAGGVWTNASSRAFKEGFAPVDVLGMLDKVVAMPISTWTYKNSPEGTHVGPMAEDFKAAFGFGSSDKQIATVDADGVALAAIQGLNQKLEAENAALKSRLDALEVRMDQQLKD